MLLLLETDSLGGCLLRRAATTSRKISRRFAFHGRVESFLFVGVNSSWNVPLLTSYIGCN